MIDALLKFVGVKIDAAQEVSSVAFQLRNTSWLGWVVFLGLLLGGYVWWAYGRLAGHRHLPPGRRRLLRTLRLVLLGLLLLLLLRPVLSFTLENRIRRTLMMLVDASGSMDIRDAREAPQDLSRAGIAAGVVKNLDQTPEGEKAKPLREMSRMEVLRAAMENPQIDLLKQLGGKYDLEYFQFDRTLAAVDPKLAFAAADPEGDNRQITALGDAIREIVGRKRGQPVAGIFLATDGANNGGSEPIEAASAAALDHMPLYVYGVGITSPRDIIVGSVFTQDVAFVKDEVAVTVRVRAQGVAGRKGRLVLKLGDTEVASQEMEYGDGAEQVVPLKFVPEQTGDFELTASIAPAEDEAVKDNNTASQRIRAIDSKIKVLVVEQAPRWEFRHIQSTLMRDRRVEAKFALLEVAPALAALPDSPYLTAFPEKKEDLFKYDLLIIGDVSPTIFSPEQMEGITEFSTKFGGACIFLAGQKYNPVAYIGTPLAKMLPVEMDAKQSAVQRAAAQRPTTLALTSQGKANPMLKLAADAATNEAIWRAFPQIQWIQRVSRAKPGAQVLLEDTDPVKTNRFGRMPAMALHQYGLGQVLYVGTDDLWLWRQGAGLAHYNALWGQMMQRMALAHLLGGSKRTQLSSDNQSYITGDKVTVFARLYDPNFEPVKDASVAGTFSVASRGAEPQPAENVQLSAVPDQPGMFRAEFVAVNPGIYKFTVAGDAATALEFEAIKPKFELGETAMNEPVLKEMARLSGGEFMREENLADFPSLLGSKDERITRIVDADLWSSPFFFTLLAAIATAEWFFRKKFQLK